MRADGLSGGREWIARAFGRVEDVVYIGLGILLAGSALVLLASGAMEFARALLAGTLPGRVVEVLDSILLVLMIVEVLYTVQVSFREHALVPEPFLIVGLIAATRREVVLIAEFAHIVDAGPGAFRDAMIELGLLAALIVALVGSLVLLRGRGSAPVAERG